MTLEIQWERYNNVVWFNRLKGIDCFSSLVKIVHFVDIGGIDDLHCLNILFITLIVIFKDY
jgi:hypothetical protein